VAPRARRYPAPVVFGKKHKPKERYYLLPGQGGQSYLRKQRRLIAWSILVALLFGGGLAVVLWWLARPRF